MNSFNDVCVEELAGYSDFLAMVAMEAEMDAASQAEFCEWIETILPSAEDFDRWADEIGA